MDYDAMRSRQDDVHDNLWFCPLYYRWTHTDTYHLILSFRVDFELKVYK